MRFAHIADTHIRNLKYHYEYKEIFKQLYQSLREEKVDCIVHCGDIAHTKTQISPEFVDLCTDFFRNLANIAPTYIILGNHDGNLKNSSRQDAISPIVNAMDHPNLHLLKDSGETVLGDPNFTFNVLSVFDEDNWAPPSNYERVNIALYHGSILSCSTDIGWIMETTDHNLNIFSDFDYAFLGDIHKTQVLDEEGRVRYPGSTVQQNFGESLDKGYLLWDIENKENFSVEHITFKNPRPFITINLTPKGRMPKNLNIGAGARLRITSSTNISLDKIRRAVQIAKHKFKPESITFLNRAAGKQISIEDITKNLVQEDLRDIKVQEKLIKEYLKDFQVEENVMTKVMQLNQKYNSVVEQSEEVSRNINWSLKSVEWDNLFNYGENNKIDFDKLNGVVGIFGKNFSGKSSIVDSILYTLYNSTSKPIRRNYSIINQNKDFGCGKVTIAANNKEYTVERSSEKYVKKLRGEETNEAKTDVEFFSKDLLGKKVSRNGLSRQDTDRNVRRMFGTIEDFLMTSMASQLGSLSFINEGSTRRKEILAKFLDLEVFDRKFKLAKEDSQETKGALKKLEDRDYDQEIKDVEMEIEKSFILTERNKSRCELLMDEALVLQEDINRVQKDIDSVPAEIINVSEIKVDLESALKNIKIVTENNQKLNTAITSNQALYQKIESFLSFFDVEEIMKKQSLLNQREEELRKFIVEMHNEESKLDINVKKQSLLEEVPCGSEYSHCKFIKDAYAATELIQISRSRKAELSLQINEAGEKIRELSPNKIKKYIDRHNQVLEKKNKIATELASNQIQVEKNNMSLMKLNIEVEDFNSRIVEYEENKEAIESLEGLYRNRRELQRSKRGKEEEHDTCQEQLLFLYKQHGSLEQQFKTLEEQKQNLQDLSLEYAAYDLLMSCCHSNGISYDIIKKRLPVINAEIAKILTNIVEFETFIENDGRRLNIFIKHPKHEPRPLELGSGAEKTIASMAIRLAFLTVSSLPKPDIFVLDEPGTALDEENMEGFVRILDMVKTYFKTVILISHLDVLKDCVDSQIIIDKKKGYAHVNI